MARCDHILLLLLLLLLLPPMRCYFSSISFVFNLKVNKLYVHRCGEGGSMRACHVVGPGSIPGRDMFPAWGFSSLEEKYQEDLGPGPGIQFGRHNYPFIFALLEWMVTWMVCIVFNVLVVSEVAPAFNWSLIRGGSPCSCVIKRVGYVCDPKLIPSPDRSRLCKAREAWVT